MMGPCHTDKSSRQVDNEKFVHSKGTSKFNMTSSSPTAHFIKPKLLFNILISDDHESNDEYQGNNMGFLKNFDTETQDNFDQSSPESSLEFPLSGTVNEIASACQNGTDLEHMAKVEMARNKMKILLSEPLDCGSDYLARSFSEPISPPPSRNILEFGKRTNSEGSQYRSLVLKKRQKEAIQSSASRESSSITEEQLTNKRMKNGCGDVDRLSLNFFEKSMNRTDEKTTEKNTSLLKRLLSKATDDEELEREYPSSSYGSMRRLIDNRRSLSNSDIYSSTSILNSFPATPPTISLLNKKVNKAVKLAASANDTLFGYLCNSVQYALCLPDFGLLPVDDKRPMIIKAVPRLILLYMAKENYRLEICSSGDSEVIPSGVADSSADSSRPTVDFVESLKMFIKRFQQYKITDKEFSYLKHIALYQYTDQNKPLVNGEPVKKSLLEAFDNLRNAAIEDKNRYSQLLLQLHSLFLLDLKTLETLFFQPLLGSVESLKKIKHLYSDGAWFAGTDEQSTTLAVS